MPENKATMGDPFCIVHYVKFQFIIGNNKLKHPCVSIQFYGWDTPCTNGNIPIIF